MVNSEAGEFAFNYSSRTAPSTNEEEKTKFSFFDHEIHEHHGRKHEWDEVRASDHDLDDFGFIRHRDRWHDRDDRYCDRPPAVPVPGSAFLFMSGLAGILGFVKRKRHKADRVS